MPYSHRFGCSNRRPRSKDFRHDPARFGIFIHGGPNTVPPWDRHAWNPQLRYHANRFTLTLPTKAPGFSEKQLVAVREAVSMDERAEHPTFARAVAHAKALRLKYAELRRCPIYSCTDCLREGGAGARNFVQCIDPGETHFGTVPEDFADVDRGVAAYVDAGLHAHSQAA